MVATEQLAPLVWQQLAMIPAGRVASYGQIARRCGYPGYARLVGAILASLPADSSLPWHRVVNARGCIVLPAAADGASEQQKRLASEGVTCRNGRVDLAACQWHPGD